MDELPPTVLKGRGAIGAMKHRFTERDRVAVDDGWWRDEEEAPPKLRTSFTPERAKTIISRNSSPDVGFDRSINPYQGCEHGCIYCFARPTHSYFNLSPGLDFESKIFFKANAAKLLEAELAKPGYKPAPIALGVNTDAYQPGEEKMRLTRAILEVLAAHNHPVSIISKSARITRDLDILAPMAAKRLVHVTVTVTSLDPAVARTLEPRASTPPKRIATIKALASAGIETSVNVAPCIPGITDSEIEAILEAAAGAGAHSAGMILLRLPWEVKDLFTAWVNEHYPDRASKVLSLIQQMRDGKLNDPNWGTRMTGSGPYAEMLRKRFDIARKRFGLDRKRVSLDATLFKCPPRAGDQLTLF